MIIIRPEKLRQIVFAEVKKVRPVLAQDTARAMSAKGLVERMGIANRMESGQGILIPVGGNPNQLVYLGQING